MFIYEEIEQNGIEEGFEKALLKLWQKGMQPNIIANYLDLQIEQVEKVINTYLLSKTKKTKNAFIFEQIEKKAREEEQTKKVYTLWQGWVESHRIASRLGMEIEQVEKIIKTFLPKTKQVESISLGEELEHQLFK